MSGGEIVHSVVINELSPDRYGAIELPLTGNELFDLGFSILDMVEVSFLDRTFLCPVIPDYNFVDSGRCALTTVKGLAHNVMLLCNGAQFVVITGLAKRSDTGWIIDKKVKFPLTITIKLVSPGGYQETFDLYCHFFENRTSNREDYPLLSDEDYCNFRTVKCGNIKEGILYRSSSPFSSRYKRDSYVNDACEKYGIKTIINLSDSEDEMDNLKHDNYCYKQHVCALGLSTDYGDKYFGLGVAKGIRFILAYKQKSLIHCMEGKDRTGFVIAVIEGLMGASLKDIENDYVLSHRNFFKIDENDKAIPIFKSKLIELLSKAFGTEVDETNIQSESYKYLAKIGLNVAEINDLCNFLGGN